MTFRLLLFLGITLNALHGMAYLQNVPGRKQTSLNGKWNFIIDPYETGYYDYRFKPSPNGFFKNAKPKGKTDFVEYSFDGAEWINVPGDWNSQYEKLMYYEGTIWYKKSFSVSKSEYSRYFIHFGAANYHTIVYINGEKVGAHEGGFTPFQFEISKNLKNGNNDVIVKVDNKRAADAIPTLNTDWWNYGGITRDVSLIEVPETYIEDYQIQLKKSSTQIMKGYVQLRGKQKQQTVRLSIPSLKIDLRFQTDSSGFYAFECKAKPILWSPENPYLYTVRLESSFDSIQEQIGFRTIEVKDRDILLNGKSVFLRGICMHEEIAQRKGRAYSEADALQLLSYAKKLGCNFVRLAHYPHNEHMTRMADAMGLMIWSEIPVYWTIQFGSELVLNKAKQQLSENILRDKNRASIIIWSIGNETPLSDSRNVFMSSLAQTVKTLDNTRLVSAALEIHGWEGEKPTIDDPLGAHLDVLGCNEYVGWYVPLKKSPEEYQWSTIYNKPLIITEFGGEATYGNHGSKDVANSWSEEYQEEMYKNQIRMLKKIDFLRGVTPWIMIDFRSPKRLLPGLQDGWNRKGLLSETGQPKKAFFVLKDYYQELEKQWRK